MGPLTFLIILGDLLRFYLPTFNSWFCQVFGFLLKPEEYQGLHGSTYFLTGSFLSILFFEKRVAIVALLFLAFADPMAAVIGGKWGQIKVWRGKTLEGSLAFFMTSFFLAFPFLGFLQAFLGALSASLVEVLPLGIDDNLTIPLLSGLVISLIPG